MFSVDQYPVAPEIAHPTAKPKIIEADFIKGDPNCSTMMTVTKTLKPRPISFGSPLPFKISKMSSPNTRIQLTKEEASEHQCWGTEHNIPLHHYS